jgi:hypothetical protein
MRPVEASADVSSADGVLSIRKLDEHVGVTALGRAPAHEVLAPQFVKRRHERWLPNDPCAVFRDDLIARAIAANDEQVAPFAGATDVDAIPRRAPAGLPGIENLAHGFLPSSWRPVRLDGAVLFLECRDGGFEFGADLGALAAVQAAAQFGAEFVDVVLKRDHRPLLLFEDGAGAPRRSGRVKDACAAKRARGEPILPRATKKVRALARSLRAAKLGGARDPWPGPIGAVRWEV